MGRVDGTRNRGRGLVGFILKWYNFQGERASVFVVLPRPLCPREETKSRRQK